MDIGTFWEGGYYAGKIQVDSKIYALVLAPKAQGLSSSSLRWKTTVTETPGTYSLNDDWANTQAMIAAGADIHPAAKFCHDLVINGCDDWYLPSVDELEMCYRVFKPTTTSNYVATSDGPYGASGINPSSIPEGLAYTSSNPTQTTLGIFVLGRSQAFTNDH